MRLPDMTPDTNQEWIRVIQQVGVPSLIALFLVWFLSNQVMAAIETHHAEMEELMQRLNVSHETSLQVNRQICLNTAPDPASQSRCIQAP